MRPGHLPQLRSQRADELLPIDTRRGAVMRTIRTNAGWCLLSVSVLVMSASWPQAGHTAEPDKPNKAESAEKRIAFTMDGKPWRDVVEWFADHSGLSFTGIITPTNTVNIKPPKNAKFTIAEIVDLLNDSLSAKPATERFVLIRRERTFHFIPGDEKPEQSTVPKIPLEELDKRGNTEIVQAVFSAGCATP